MGGMVLRKPGRAGPIGRIYRDDFAVADVTNAGPNFRIDSGTARIVSQRLQSRASGLHFYTFIGSGDYNASGALSSPNQRITAQLAQPSGTLSATSGTFLRLRCPFSFTGGLYALIYVSTNGSYQLNTYNGTGSATVRASGSGTGVTVNSKIVFEAIGNTYKAYRDDLTTPFASWTDTGNAVSQANRAWGLGTQGTATTTGSPAVEWVTAEDLAA